MEHAIEIRHGSRSRIAPVVAIALVAALAITGCAGLAENPKAAIGGLGGATMGGLIAAAAGGGGAGIAAGVIGGALLGGLVGNFLDDRYGTACRQPDGSWKVQG
jgi:hypothetical protein